MVPASQPVNLEHWQQSRVNILSPLFDNSADRSGLLWWEALSHFLPLPRWVQVMYISLQTRTAALATSKTLVESHYQQTSAMEKGLHEEALWSINIILMFMENTGGLHTLMVHPEGLSEWVSPFLTIILKNIWENYIFTAASRTSLCFLTFMVT